MWQVTVDGRTFRLDDLTVGQAGQIAAQAQVDSPYRLTPHVNPTHALLLCRAWGVDPDRVRLGDFRRSTSDVPTYFEDGLPRGGRLYDDWVVLLTRRGFTPRQIREEFTMRDLALLSAAAG